MVYLSLCEETKNKREIGSKSERARENTHKQRYKCVNSARLKKLTKINKDDIDGADGDNNGDFGAACGVCASNV